MNVSSPNQNDWQEPPTEQIEGQKDYSSRQIGHACVLRDFEIQQTFYWINDVSLDLESH